MNTDISVFPSLQEVNIAGVHTMNVGRGCGGAMQEGWTGVQGRDQEVFIPVKYVVGKKAKSSTQGRVFAKSGSARISDQLFVSERSLWQY